MNLEVSIEPWPAETDATGLIKFRRRFLPTHLSLSDERKLWRWKFFDNPWREPDIPAALVARKAGALAGLMGLMPGRFIVGHRATPAIGLVDYCVDPECRGAGIPLLSAVLQKFPRHALFTASANFENETTNRMYTALKFSRIASHYLVAPAAPSGNSGYVHRIYTHLPAALGAPVRDGGLSHAVDPQSLRWRYEQYPLASPLFVSLQHPGGPEHLCAVVQISELDRQPCLMVMEYFMLGDLVADGRAWFAGFVHALHATAPSVACRRIAISVSGEREKEALISAGFELVEGPANLGCWIKLPASLDPGGAVYLSLGTGDRFFTNVGRPPAADRGSPVFVYRLKDPNTHLDAIAGRKTLLIRTSPYDHWAFVLERALALCGAENVTVLTNLDMPESFSYLYPPLRILKYPRGRLTAEVIPAGVRDELLRTDFDQVIFSAHGMSVQYPREIVDAFANIFDFVRTVWPRDSLAVWVADWAYELKRLDDHFFELERFSHEKLGLEYLSVLIKNKLTPLLTHLESFNALVARPAPVPAFSEKNMLFIAPHQDDEVIGCGGTILKNAAEGKTVQIVYLTDGAYRSGPWSRSEMTVVRKEEARRVAGELGVAEPVFLDCPAIPTFVIKDEKVRELAGVFTGFQPDAVWIPFAFDAHPDHRRANVMLARVLREFYPRPITVYAYEIWSTLPANVLVDITGWMEKKRKAIAMFKSQSAAFDYVHCTSGTNSHRSWLAGGAGYFEAFFRLSGPDYVRLVEQITESDRM
ncbi:MAG: hypothetical protein A3G34_14135 [Candidatus Lindowbacteria bacterium RIFCSPLOWO2_12_FULL_62_27]|nr:MAG: hypothetical protein A3G34_14135 [Candidatus Lindowbacteria bacterium RIFCSPLOWO2_12_FULL_62_27]